MIIFVENYKIYCYIHIPKNSGTYYENEIKKNDKCKVISFFWGVKHFFDLAHIPYMLINRYVPNLSVNNVEFITHTRNPYDRVISAYFYLHPKKNTKDFKLFIANELTNFVFDIKFYRNIIHFYPQYFFVCNNDLEIPKNIKIDKVENVFSNFRKYKLSDYYDTNSIHLINKIYNLDFKLFDYEVLNKI